MPNHKVPIYHIATMIILFHVSFRNENETKPNNYETEKRMASVIQ